LVRTSCGRKRSRKGEKAGEASFYLSTSGKTIIKNNHLLCLRLGEMSNSRFLPSGSGGKEMFSPAKQGRTASVKGTGRGRPLAGNGSGARGEPLQRGSFAEATLG